MKILLILILFFNLNLQAREWNSIRIGTVNNEKPFSFIDKDNNLIGFEIDFIYAICEQLKISCSVASIEWNNLFNALKENKFDAIFASIRAIEERKKFILFSQPYLKSSQGFIAKKGQYKHITNQTLSGKIIGVIFDTVHEKYLRANFPNSIIQTYKSHEAAFVDLLNAKVDLIFSDLVISYSLFLDKPIGREFGLNGKEIIDPVWFGEGISIGMKKGDSDLQLLFNNAITELYNNGTMKKLNNRWLSKVNLLLDY